MEPRKEPSTGQRRGGRRNRTLYANDACGVEVSNTVYVLDATTIDLCLSMFPWAAFPMAKAAVTLHPRLDLRRAILRFLRISDGTSTTGICSNLLQP